MSQPLEQYYVPCPFVPGDIVWSYLRYSTDDQSIASQELAVREWCKQHQLNLARVFIDEAKSGKNTAGRDQFLLMIQLLQDTHLSPRPAGVVFWNMARFARDYDDAQFYKASLRRLGYILHSMTDQIPPGRVGRIVESIKDFANAEEAIQRSLEAKRGLWERAKQGFNTGGFPPRGYRRSAPISLGRKKNGEERFAYRWEIDPEWESRVRKAWQMRLAGQNLHAIHRETRIFNAINSYVSMFSNITYAGYRKCGEMLVPNAHDAYVTKDEFDRVQRMRRATPGNPKSPKGDPRHSRRQSSPFLLSGILYCGICGAAMVGDRDRGKPFYRCGQQQRSGRTVCNQSTIVAWYLHRLVCEWLATNVLNYEYLVRARDKINQHLLSDKEKLLARRDILLRDLQQLEKRVQHLIDAIEQVGLTDDIRGRLQERQIEARGIESELAMIETALQQRRIEVSDEALKYLAHQMSTLLLEGEPTEVRGILQNILVRVELGREQLKLYYSTPLVEYKTWIKEVPPREFESLSWP